MQTRLAPNWQCIRFIILIKKASVVFAASTSAAMGDRDTLHRLQPSLIALATLLRALIVRLR